jgi:hypothetical protein
VFLGDTVDLQVSIGQYELLARAHPSLGAPAGGPVFLRFDAEKCIALADDK